MAGTFGTQVGTFGAAWLLLAGVCAGAEPAVRISFDGPDRHWRLLDDGLSARMVAHDSVPVGARNAGGSERIVVAAPEGRSALVACGTPRMPLLDEFRARLWVKASLPGAQLAVQVVLPRTIDPATGRAMTTIVRGPLSQQAEHWQQLELVGVTRLFANQVRVLRARPAAAIDPREAYIDAIVLSVPGDPQGTQVLTDELEVEGVVFDAMAGDSTAKSSGPGNATVVSRVDAPVGQSGARATPRVRMQGSALLVDDKPFAPRAIDWHGEPLKFLAERGFNAVQLPEPPTRQLLNEAEQQNVWIICPPPREPLDEATNATRWERILVWRLEDEAASGDPAHFRHWADTIRARNDLPPRPILVAAYDQWAAMSEFADVLLARHPRDATLSTTEFDQWFTAGGRLARPGTPIWVSVPSQLGDLTHAQAAAMSGLDRFISVDADLLEATVRTAITRGCRGLLFRSGSPLGEPDSVTRRRAALLALMNRHLMLVHAWMAGGAAVGEASSADGAHAAVILSVDRARLLAPVNRLPAKNEQARPSNDDQKRSFAGVDGATTSSGVSYTVPGIPDSNSAYQMTPASLRPVATRRVAGGTRLVLETADDSLVVITQDPQVIVGLRQRIAHDGPSMLRLLREWIGLQSAAVADTSGRLARFGVDVRAAGKFLAAADSAVRQGDALLAAQRADEAYASYSAGRRFLRQAADEQRRTWSAREGGGSYPLGIAYETLVEHAESLRQMSALGSGENLLYGGDFEDLGQLTPFGWHHVAGASNDVSAHAELSSNSPYHGAYCLRMGSEASDADSLARPQRRALQILSPAVRLDAGQLVEISGWARVTSTSPGPASLEIEDSLGGHELAIDVSPTTGWQPFHMVRAATKNELVVSFSLVGQGSAELDAVMIRPLRQPIARRLPPADSRHGNAISR
jgi:hypothetical protein